MIVGDYFRLCATGDAGDDGRGCFWESNFDIHMSDLFKFDFSGIVTTFPIYIFAFTCLVFFIVLLFFFSVSCV